MRERRREVALGVALLAVAALVMLVPLYEPDLLALINVGVRDTQGIEPLVPARPFGVVLLRPAFAVILVWAGIVRLVLARRSALTVVLADLALTAPVTVFLVAMVNGITDVTALVPLYALTTAAWLLVVLQSRVEVVRGHPLLPLCFAAGVGIVPWGVIALAQIVGDAPEYIRIATILALVGQLVVAFLLWRTARGGRASVADTAAAVVLVITALVVLLGADIGNSVFS